MLIEVRRSGRIYSVGNNRARHHRTKSNSPDLRGLATVIAMHYSEWILLYRSIRKLKLPYFFFQAYVFEGKLQLVINQLPWGDDDSSSQWTKQKRTKDDFVKTLGISTSLSGGGGPILYLGGKLTSVVNRKQITLTPPGSLSIYSRLNIYMLSTQIRGPRRGDTTLLISVQDCLKYFWHLFKVIFSISKYILRFF